MCGWRFCCTFAGVMRKMMMLYAMCAMCLCAAFAQKPTGKVVRTESMKLTEEELEARIAKHLEEAGKNAPEYVSEKMLPDWETEPLGSVEELLQYADKEEEDGMDVYYPTGSEYDENQNAIHFYFKAKNGIAKSACLAMYYYADASLDIESVDFVINDETHNFKPSEITSGSEEKMYWEWFDEEIKPEHERLIFLFAHAYWGTMRIRGRQCSLIRKLSEEQLSELRNSAQLYYRMRQMQN